MLGRFFISDNTVDFRTKGILYNEIVTTAGYTAAPNGAQARVRILGNLVSAVDEWTDIVTFAVVDGPPVGTAYTVWRTDIAYIDTSAGGSISGANHTIATDRLWWGSTNGDAVTPVVGSPYRLIPRGTYQGIQVNQGAINTRIRNSNVRGSWADAISCFDAVNLDGCLVEDNNDQGFTLSNPPNRGLMQAHNCRVINQGRGGFYTGSTHLKMVGCSVDGWGWMGNALGYPGGSYAAQINCFDASVDLTVKTSGRACESVGVMINSVLRTDLKVRTVGTFSATGKKYWAYTYDGSSQATCYIDADDLINTSKSTISDTFGTPTVSLSISQSPNGYQGASIGSRVTDRVSGLTWLKTSGTGKTGWTVVTTAAEAAWSAVTTFGVNAIAWHRVHGNVTSPGGITTVADLGTENKPLASPTVGTAPAFGAQSAFAGRTVLTGATGKAVTTTAWSSALTQPTTLFWCGSMPSIAGLAQFFSDKDGANGLSARENNGGLEVFAGTIVSAGIGTAALAANAPFVMCVEFDTSTSKVTVWVNDSHNPNVYGAPGALGMTGLTILGLLSAGAVSREMIGGFYSESVVVNRKTTEAERKAAMVGIGNLNGIDVVSA